MKSPAGEDSHGVMLCASQIYGSPGGIQTYMRLLARTLEDGECLAGMHSLADTPESPRLLEAQNRTGAEFVGHGDSKLRFSTGVASSVESEQTLLFGHVALSPLGWALKKAGRIRDYAIILHGVEAWERLPWLQRRALRNAAAVICTTPFTERKVHEANGFDQGDLTTTIVPLAVEPGRFDEVELDEVQRELDGAPLEVLTVARMASAQDHKGYRHMIDAVGKLRDRGIDVQYEVVGDGDDRPNLERRVDRHELSDRIRFHGRVSDEELDERFRSADVYAMPSEGEGFGLVYLEAMHYGLPAVASPEGGAQHVVDDGDNGLFAEYGNPEAIADALERLVDDELRRRLGRQGRHDVETRYSYERFRDDVLEVCERFALG